MPSEIFSSFDICLIEDCNLRCRYCSTGFGRWGGTPRVMKKPVIDRTIDFILGNSTPEFNIGFSGGETFMAFDKLQYFIERLFQAKKKQNKKIFVELSTNALLLTELIIDFLIKHRISLVFSIDGNAQTTNRNRVSQEGKGVYGPLRSNFLLYKKQLQERSPHFQPTRADCTVDSKTCLSASVQHLFDLGFNEVLARPVSPSEYTGFTDTAANHHFLTSMEQLIRTVLEPLDLSDIITGSYQQMLMNIREPILSLIKPESSSISCGALKRQICITAGGEIVPCFLLYRTPRDQMNFGTVFDGINQTRMIELSERFETSRSGCQACWAKPFCSQCYLYVKEMSESNLQFGSHPYCQLVKRSLTILKKELALRYPTKVSFHDDEHV